MTPFPWLLLLSVLLLGSGFGRGPLQPSSSTESSSSQGMGVIGRSPMVVS